MRVPVPTFPDADTLASSSGTLRDRVVAALRQSIVSGRIPPGTRLSEPSLARELRVSRGPVREAIRELAAEGLVRIESRVGTFVTHPEAREVEETFAIKGVLEGLAARLACEQGTEASRRAHLMPPLEALERASGAADSATYLACSRRFHEAIFDLAGNTRLAAMHRTLNDQLMRLCGPLVTPDSVARYSREDRAVTAAIVANRPGEAERIARAHVCRAAQGLLALASASAPRLLKAR